MMLMRTTAARQTRRRRAQPPETNFDYANPQEFLRRRQEMMQQQQQQSGPGAAPAMFPGTVLPAGGPPAGHPGAHGRADGAHRIGAAWRNRQAAAAADLPESLRAALQRPARVGHDAGTMEPDRAKYANPYQPTPPPPQQDE